MHNLSDQPVRSLSVADLHLDHLSASDVANEGSIGETEATDLAEDDRVVVAVTKALRLGFAGVILSGPPGTGKSWYAQQVAVAITKTWETIRSIQFHPSYQYEDFVFGYQATTSGKFEVVAKQFAVICSDASADPDRTYVLIIDEISRSDVVRVFGEALTYLESDKRDLPFQTAMGEDLSVPSNLVIIGTMNPWDKGVDELDAALERRFAQVDIEPNSDILRSILTKTGADPKFVDRVVEFFDSIQSEKLERLHLGHAYFLKCTDEAAAQDIWDLRLYPTLRRACNLDRTTLDRLTAAWSKVVTLPGEDIDEGDQEEARVE